MGLTDNENPIGLMPFLMPGLGIGGRRRRRDLELPEPDVSPKDVPGGERCAYEVLTRFCFSLLFVLVTCEWGWFSYRIGSVL